jgi:hypothetical protein
MLGKWGLLTLAFLLALAACAFWIDAMGPSTKPSVVRLQFVVVLLVLVGLCVAAGMIVHGRIDGILIDERNRVSLARFQWVLWFLVILSGYFTEAIWNAAKEADPPTIQNQLLALLGITSGSAVISSLITDAKKAAPPPVAPVVVAPANAAAVPPRPCPACQLGAMACHLGPDNASWSDLYTGEEAANFGIVDVSRLQKLVVTILLVMAFMVFLWGKLGEAATATALAMPTFDENGSFLWLLGISHAAYLAQKATPKPA